MVTGSESTEVTGPLLRGSLSGVQVGRRQATGLEEVRR